MVEPTSNDNEALQALEALRHPDALQALEALRHPDTRQALIALREPDAHGQAAMLLTESLLHGLIARNVITVGDAVEMVEIAAEVKEAIAEDLGDSPATMQKSLALLGSIRASLANDVVE